MRNPRCGATTVKTGRACRRPVDRAGLRCHQHGGPPRRDRPAARTAAADTGRRWATTGTEPLAVHPNDHVRLLTPASAPPLPHVTGRRLTTVDLDATLFDSWACCKRRARGFSSDPDCTHLRHDTLDAAQEVCERHDATLVVMSWRAGLVDVSRRWLEEVGIDPAALFIPGSPDDVSGLVIGRDHTVNRARYGGGQVAFKVATITALREHYGCEIVASFDDNAKVIQALAAAGVPDARQVPHLVDVAPHEWHAGYVGAPKPPPLPPLPSYRGRDRSGGHSTGGGRGGLMPLWDDDPRGDDPWGELAGICSVCGGSAPPGPGTLCGRCEHDVGADIWERDQWVSWTDDSGQQRTGRIVELDDLGDVVVRRDDDGELDWVWPENLRPEQDAL